MIPKSNGAVVWQGPSLFNGEEIVLIFTGIEKPSQNRKTGQMIQSYVLMKNIEPLEGVKTGKDVGVCNLCPLRQRVCYLDMRHINSIWHKYKAGGYPEINQETLARLKRRHEILRITAYGEATAVPFEVWERIFRYCKPGTGYTHQWANCDVRWKKYLMASVESPALAYKAQAMGWRTFRITLPEEPLMPNEMLCRNYVHEHISCEDCRLCDGANGKANIADPIHGINWKKNSFEEIRGIKVLRSKDKSFPDHKVIHSWQFDCWQKIVDTTVRRIVASRGLCRDGWSQDEAEDFISRKWEKDYHYDYASDFLRNRDPQEVAYDVLDKIENEGWMP